MISVFNGMAERDYTQMGDCVLTPLSCGHRQVAGGGYDLTLVHPIDHGRKWEWLREGNIIKAPVQRETLANAYAGTELWIYETNAAAKLRATAQDPTTISYDEWSNATEYEVGDKVTYYSKNYKCTFFDTSSGQRMVPPNNSTWWTQIPNQTSGGTVVADLQAGTKLIWISGTYQDTWWQMATYYGGISGYIKQSELTNERHLTPEEVQPVTIEWQLFRIRKVTVETSGMTVTAEAEHVSYDMSECLIKKAEISRAVPALAIQYMMDGLYEPYEAGNVYTNLTDDSNGTYTGTLKGKNMTFALLDPDSGIVGTFDAELRRNNWDLYIMQRTNTDRGYRLTYGKNLKGVSWTRSDSDTKTRIIPVAKDENGDELYLDDIYVDSDYISSYPVIRTEQLTVNGQVGKDDGTGTDTAWTKATLQAEMESKAQERFDVDHCDLPTVEVTVEFEQLGDTVEYAQYKHLETAVMYDVVYARDDRIGMNLELRVSEIEYDCIREKVTGLKLSNVIRADKGTVAGYSVRNGVLTAGKIDLQTMDSIISDAADRAVQILS